MSPDKCQPDSPFPPDLLPHVSVFLPIMLLELMAGPSMTNLVSPGPLASQLSVHTMFFLPDVGMLVPLG